MTTSAAFSRDANYVPITTIGIQVSPKTIAFDGTTGKGATGTSTLYTVTGVVYAVVAAICTEDLVGDTATIAGGVAGNTGVILGTQTATDLDNHVTWWNSIAPGLSVEPLAFNLIDQNIIMTVGTAAITDGTLKFYCNWIPLSSDGNVVAA